MGQLGDHHYTEHMQPYILESCTGKKLCYRPLPAKKIFFPSPPLPLNFCDFYSPSPPRYRKYFYRPLPASPAAT